MFLANSWKEFDPDLIIIGVTINDHTDIQPYPKYDVVYGYLVYHQANKANQIAIDPETGLPKRAVPTSPLMRFKVFMHEHSYLYSLLSIAGKNLVAACQADEGDNENERVELEVEEAWEKASERLDQIRELAEENDSGLVLVFIPHRSQVHPGLAVDAHIVSGYFDDWDRRIENYSRKHDILFINLLPYLVERAQRGETLYFLETDAHWNPNGHEVAARVICDFLTQEFLVKEDK